MKKYVILTLISLTIILMIFASGNSTISNIEYVSAVKAEKKTAVEIINYSGTVEYRNSTVCSAKGAGVIQSVLAESGDFVTKGDPVLTVFQTESEISNADIMSAITSGDFQSIVSAADGDISSVVYEAPSTGIISGLDIEENSFFQKGQILFKVSPEQSFQVRINALEKDIPKLKIGQSVKIDCKAVPDILYGTVDSIGSSAKQTTTASGKETTVKITVKIDGENKDIKSGYTASCSIKISEKSNALLIPYSCVGKDEDNKNFVYLLKNGALKKQFVSCGTEYSNGMEILSGLSDGDIVVSDCSKVKDISSTVVNEVKGHAE